MKNYCIIFSTIGKKEDAERIANEIVKKKLAACVNILEIKNSIYRWKGKICKEKEFLMIFKTTKTKSKRLMKEIKVLHPYEVPEIIMLPIIDGLEEYLDWIEKETM
ncbi:MAG: divalent-cation tolerance protein CutA [Candidatus Parvarchaeota archaeon]|nr:divalent-cation tolerance protein CutA [Candidatus Jingweiarchaeum tengchongense]MCW1305846.1 divalent-cation tolerance protein CutA [Candidatus Jingweiarchaeum tengchongense]MCW1309150.1 divalent-cation tolerance protein CutA [Candidatus Jingweiarchaeum tengchongense]